MRSRTGSASEAVAAALVGSRDPAGDGMNQRAAPVVPEISAAATSWDPYLAIRALASYSSLSERLLRSFLSAPDHPLPHFRVGSRVLVRRSDFDDWIQIFRQPAHRRGAEAIVRSLLGLDDTHESPHRHERSTVTPRRRQ